MDEIDEMAEFEDEEERELTPKEQFQALVRTILSLNEGAGPVYEQLTATAAPFDRELADRLEACRRADEALIAYCRSKAEN
jgi:endonuclease III